jgi:hypothetical protein
LWYLFAVSLGLSAPAAVSIEVRSQDRRVFRLSREIGEGGVRLERPAPFEPGRPVDLRFALPGSTGRIVVSAEVVTTGDTEEQEGSAGGAALYFLDITPEARAEIAGYVAGRLGLPPLR